MVVETVEEAVAVGKDSLCCESSRNDSIDDFMCLKKK